MSDEEDVSSIFNKLHVSVFSKAFNISSSLRSSSVDDDSENKGNNKLDGGKEGEGIKSNTRQGHLNGVISSPAISCSTPKSKNQNYLKLKKQSSSQKHSEKALDSLNLSPVSESGTVPDGSFSLQKLLHICDVQRCLTVEKVMTERIQNMYETEKLLEDSFRHLKQARLEEASTKWILMEQKILDDVHEEINKIKPRREAQLAEDNLKNAQRVMERNQRVKDAENEARKKSEAILLNRKRLYKILSCQQKEYVQLYKDTVALINTCENKNLLMERTNNLKDLKNCSAEYENLFKKIKTNITEEDVDELVKLVAALKQIHISMSGEIEKISAEAKRVPEVPSPVEPVKEQAEKVEKKSEDKDKDKTDLSDLSDCFDAQSLRTYLDLKAYLDNSEVCCKELLEDNALKVFRFNCQKAVTIPVNAISPVSGRHLTDKYMKLHNLLSGKTVDAGGIQVSASEHPNGIAYCKKLLAKKFVRQGDLTVSSKPDAAFSIAAVLASLWVDFPDFGKLTLAYFQKSCPYIAPVFMPQIEGQSVEDYHKSLGYQYTENNEIEKQDSFLKRMSGIMRLYSAVLISKVHQQGKQNPLGIKEGWRWISALLNLEPRPDICATLLFVFLEVAGNEMLRVYGAQFKKLLAYICQVYFPKLEKITPASSGGPIVRLDGFLQKVIKNESIPPPEGLLPPNFW